RPRPVLVEPELQTRERSMVVLEHPRSVPGVLRVDDARHARRRAIERLGAGTRALVLGAHFEEHRNRERPEAGAPAAPLDPSSPGAGVGLTSTSRRTRRSRSAPRIGAVVTSPEAITRYAPVSTGVDAASARRARATSPPTSVFIVPTRACQDSGEGTVGPTD